jgi:putative DNA primase/helicase
MLDSTTPPQARNNDAQPQQSPESLNGQHGPQIGPPWLPPTEEITLAQIVINDLTAIRAITQKVKPLMRHHFEDEICAAIFGAASTIATDSSAKEISPSDVARQLEENADDPNTANPEIDRAALDALRRIADKVPGIITDKPAGAAKKEALRLAGLIQRRHETALEEPKSAQNEGFAGFAGSPPYEIPEFFNAPQLLAWPLRPVPPLKPEMLPEAFRRWIIDSSERMSAPIEFIAVAALTSAASLGGRTVGILPHPYDDWLVIPNLWAANVGRPGTKKTPAQKEGLRPLKTLVAEAIEAHNANRESLEAENLLLKAKADAAKSRLASCLKKPNSIPESELRGLAEEASRADKLEPPKLKRYHVSDSTVEALVERLKENARGLLLERDELMGWLRSLEKQGREGDRPFFLEAFNGTAENIPIDRISRESFIAPHCCLSLIGTIQPGPLSRHVRSAAGSDAAKDGLISRFQLLVYPDAKPYRRVDRAPDRQAYERALNVFRWLDSMKPETAGATLEQFQTVPTLRFAPDAQQLFNEWFDALETRLTGATESVLMEEHLSKYRSLMPSLALLFHLIAIADGKGERGPISYLATVQAAAWCEFLEEHARRVYHCAFDGDTAGAELLGERLSKLDNPFTPRDVVKKGWEGLKTPEDTERALDYLEEKHWIKQHEQLPNEKGGRPSLRYFIHPALLADKETAR